MRFEAHTFRFHYIPIEYVENGDEGSYRVLTDAKEVYAQHEVSSQFFNHIDKDPRFKQALLDELTETLKEFMEEVIKVNQQRLESNGEVPKS